MSVNERFLQKVSKADGCWNWTASLCGRGYGRFFMNGKAGRAHRAAWVLFVGPIPDGLHVLHRCDNRLCVNPDHLFLGTNIDNIADCNAKGRRPSGVKHCHAKLTAESLAYVRSMRGKIPGAQLARSMGLHPLVVQVVWRGKTYVND